MKRLLILVMMAYAVNSVFAGEVISLNNNWRFFSNIEGSSDAAQIINLPHTWSSDALAGKRDYFRGIGNYIHGINVPTSWQGKRIYVKFHGAGTHTSLFVDNRYVGEHAGGGTAFVFDITKYVKYGGTSFLWAVVSNSQTLDILPTAGLNTVYGGLYRDVELVVADSTHFDIAGGDNGVAIVQKNITSERAEIEAKIKGVTLSNNHITVRGFVIGEKGDTVACGSLRVRADKGKIECSMPMVVNSPRLWSGIQDPYRYKMSFKLVEGDLERDSVEMQVGLRHFHIDAVKGVILNGKPYPVRGISMYGDRAGVGLAVTKYQVREDLDLVMEMGANFIKVCGLPQSNYFYNECDRRGLLVWSELPLIGPVYMTDHGFVNRESFKRNGRNVLREMIRQNYNHASIVLWGIFSNLSTGGDTPIPYIKELNAIANQEDPTRMTACSSNQDGEINFITSTVMWSHGFGWNEGVPEDMGVWLERYRQDWSGKLLAAVSYGAGGSIYHQADSLVHPRRSSRWHPENWQTHIHRVSYPYMCDTTGLIWGWFVNHMFDYGATGRDWGEGVGVEDTGLVTFDRKYRKDAFYFYKANWNRKVPFVYIAERRADIRQKENQNIVLFTNADSAELVINGQSIGYGTATNGTVVFENVLLRRGSNSIKARINEAEDRTIMYVIPENVKIETL